MAASPVVASRRQPLVLRRLDASAGRLCSSIHSSCCSLCRACLRCVSAPPHAAPLRAQSNPPARAGACSTLGAAWPALLGLFACLLAWPAWLAPTPDQPPLRCQTSEVRAVCVCAPEAVEEGGGEAGAPPGRVGFSAGPATSAFRPTQAGPRRAEVDPRPARSLAPTQHLRLCEGARGCLLHSKIHERSPALLRSCLSLQSLHARALYMFASRTETSLIGQCLQFVPSTRYPRVISRLGQGSWQPVEFSRWRACTIHHRSMDGWRQVAGRFGRWMSPSWPVTTHICSIERLNSNRNQDGRMLGHANLAAKRSPAARRGRRQRHLNGLISDTGKGELHATYAGRTPGPLAAHARSTTGPLALPAARA